MLKVRPGYEPLAFELQSALDQAQYGKGVERHACGEPFNEQPIIVISKFVGLGFPLGQSIKKTIESLRFSQPADQLHELDGAINYLAAAKIVIREQGGLQHEDENTEREEVINKTASILATS